MDIKEISYCLRRLVCGLQERIDNIYLYLPKEIVELIKKYFLDNKTQKGRFVNLMINKEYYTIYKKEYIETSTDHKENIKLIYRKDERIKNFKNICYDVLHKYKNGERNSIVFYCGKVYKYSCMYLCNRFEIIKIKNIPSMIYGDKNILSNIKYTIELYHDIIRFKVILENERIYEITV